MFTGWRQYNFWRSGNMLCSNFKEGKYYSQRFWWYRQLCSRYQNFSRVIAHRCVRWVGYSPKNEVLSGEKGQQNKSVFCPFCLQKRVPVLRTTLERVVKACKNVFSGSPGNSGRIPILLRRENRKTNKISISCSRSSVNIPIQPVEEHSCSSWLRFSLYLEASETIIYWMKRIIVVRNLFYPTCVNIFCGVTECSRTFWDEKTVLTRRLAM